MNDEIRIPVGLPLDVDGFLRRTCPSCEQDFKWFSHEQGDLDAEVVAQYFCPLCGIASAPNTWTTKAQADYMTATAAPAVEQFVQDEIAKALKGVKFKRNKSWSLGIDTPDAIAEPDDMTIAEPPCHRNEPIKVPAEATSRLYCIICRSEFAV